MLPFFSTFLNSRSCFFPLSSEEGQHFFFSSFYICKEVWDRFFFFLVKRSMRLDYILGGVYCMDLITYWVDCTIWPPPFNTTCPTASYSLSCIPLQVSFDWDSVHRGSSKSRKGIRASHAWLVLCKFHNNLNNQSEITCNLKPDLSAYKINAMHFSLLLGCPFLCQRGVNFPPFPVLLSLFMWGVGTCLLSVLASSGLGRCMERMTGVQIVWKLKHVDKNWRHPIYEWNPQKQPSSPCLVKIRK